LQILAYTPPFSLPSLLAANSFAELEYISFKEEVAICATECIGNGRTLLHKLGIEAGSVPGSVTSMKHQVMMARKEF